MDIDLELDLVIEVVKKEKAKLVCIQLPDGLKPKAKDIIAELSSKTDAEYMIYAGTCFGACDIPKDLENLNVDLLLQWGHNELLWDKSDAFQSK